MKDTIMYKEIVEQIDRVIPCYEYNSDLLNLLGKTINDFKPSNIVIAARGTSMNSGIYAKYQFERYFKIPVSIAAPSIFTVYNTELDLSKTLVIAISQSGKGLDILEVVKKANKSGALTIGITNELESLIAKEVKYHLYCNANKAIAFPATKTYTLTMYLITKLLYEITNDYDLIIDENKLIDSLKNSFNHQEKINEIVNYFKNVNNAVVLTRGFGLTLAMETALKIKETSHFDINAFPISEFYHGPIAMINKNTPLIFLGLDSIANNEINDLTSKINGITCYKLLITNNNSKYEVNDIILINEKNDLYALFTGIIITQLFSLTLSFSKNKNPDTNNLLKNISTF